MAAEKEKAAEKPVEQTPPPPAPTPEELQAEAAAFIESNFGSGATGLVKEEKKTEPAPEKPNEEKSAAEAPKSEGEEGGPRGATDPTNEKPAKEKGKRFVPAKKSATPEEVEAIARRVAAEEREQMPEKAPAREPEPPIRDEELNLTDENRETLDVIAEMEASNPEKYKDLGRSVRKFWRAEEQRIEKWRQDHPDEPYDPNAQEHAEFYRRNEPSYSQRDFAAASRGRIEKAAAQKVEEKLRKEYEPKFKAIEAKELERQAAPKIAESVADAVESVFKAAPEFEKLIEPGKLTKETVEKLAEINPALHDYAVEEAEEVMAVVEEIEKLTHLRNHHPFDPTKAQELQSTRKLTYPHATIARTLAALEGAMLEKPLNERIDGGREFITNHDFIVRQREIENSPLTPEAKNRKMQDLEKRTWRWGLGDVREFIIKQSSNRVSHRAKKYASFTKEPSANGESKTGQTDKTPEAEKPSAKSGLAKGTATSSASDTADNSLRDKTGEQKETEEFVRAAFG